MNSMSIDISGTWSHRQAVAVRVALEDELLASGRDLLILDTTYNGGGYQTALLLDVCAKCQEHECVCGLSREEVIRRELNGYARTVESRR